MNGRQSDADENFAWNGFRFRQFSNDEDVVGVASAFKNKCFHKYSPVVVVAWFSRPPAASSITFATSFGCDSITAGLAGRMIVVALICLAMLSSYSFAARRLRRIPPTPYISS